MNSAADDFMVIQQKNRDFSFFAHKRSLTHSPFPAAVRRDNVPLFRQPVRLLPVL